MFCILLYINQIVIYMWTANTTKGLRYYQNNISFAFQYCVLFHNMFRLSGVIIR
jgi:hypothetical protein